MNTKNSLLHANACAAAIMFLLVVTSLAETVTWDGSGDSTWTNPDSTSWTGGTYDNGDDAQFLGSGAGTITLSGTINPGSVTVNSASNYTFTGAQIAGSGTLTKDGTGTLILTSNTAYSGDTNINGGVMELQLSSGFGGTNSDFNINNGSTLRFVKTTGNGFVLDGADVVNFGSSGGGLMDVVSGNFVVRGSTITTAGGAENTIQGAFNMDAGDVIFNVVDGTDANDLTVSAALANSAGIVKQGAGTMLATNVTYGGATTVDGGVLVLDESDNTYNGGAININNGATLRLDNQTGTYLFGGDSFNFGATGGNTLEIVSGHNHVWSGNNTVTTNGGTGNTLTGSNINTNSGGSAGTLTFNIADGTDATDLIVSTTISNGGGITKTGAGTLSLTGANSYTGDTNINGGVLELQATGGFRFLSSNVHNINNGSTLRFTRNGGNGFVLDAGDAINFGSSGGGTLDTNVASFNNFVVRGTTFTTQGGTGNTIQGSFNMDAGDVTFNVADGTDASDLTVSAVLANAAGIVKQGAGTMELTGVNTYSGATTISAGTLEIGGSGQLGSGSYAQAIANNGTFNYNSSADQTLSGLISGSGAVVKDNSGNLTITASNTYSGGTTINGGTVILGSGASENALGSGTVTMNSGGSLKLWINPTGSHTIDNAFTMDGGTVYSQDGQYNLTGAMTLNAGGGTLGGTWSDKHIQVSGVISGVGGLTIEDFPSSQTGDVILSGVNTYTGDTTVSSGTLTLSAADNNIASSSSIDVASGAILDVSGITNGFALASGQTLSGAGTVSGDMTIASGSVISPGNSPGTLATGSQTWEDGGAFLWEINDSGGTQGADPGWDWLDITGALDLSSLTAGGFTIDIDSLTASNVVGDAVGFDTFTKGDGILDYSFVIASATGGITGFDADDFVLDSSGFSNAPQWDWQIVLSGSDLVLEAYAVPEPSSTALLGLGLSSLLLRRRRS